MNKRTLTVGDKVYVAGVDALSLEPVAPQVTFVGMNGRTVILKDCRGVPHEARLDDVYQTQAGALFRSWFKYYTGVY